MQNLWQSLPISVAKVLPIQFTIPLGLGANPFMLSAKSKVLKASDVPSENSPAANTNWLGVPAGVYTIEYLKDGVAGSKASYAVSATGILNTESKAAGVREQPFAQFAQDMQAGFASGSMDSLGISSPLAALGAAGTGAGAEDPFKALAEWRSSPAGIVTSLLSTAGMGLLTYHGYKRNNGSVGWALCWGLLGGIIWPVTVPIAFAQGLGKPKAPKQNPEPSAQRRVRLVQPASSTPEAQARIAAAQAAERARIAATRKCRNCGALEGKGRNCCECGTCNCC